MAESIETVIIGAGHAGLSASYCLKQRKREHIILDKAGRPGNAWRNERWDSFTFVSPNWSFLLPGGEYDGPEPDGFMGRDEIVGRLDRYVEKHDLPVAYNTFVTAVKPMDGGGYVIQTRDKEYQAQNVVAANGWFQVGKKPPFAAQLSPAILQIHTSQYRNPHSLPPGAVLVVGSGQSGAQVAEELYESGRKVFLATGRAPHSPRRYRGKDVFKWMIESGFVDQEFEQMQQSGRPFVAPMFSGKNGGRALNLHKFYRDGVTLLGHAKDYADDKMIFAPDVKENLGMADASQRFLLNKVDEYIQRAGLDAPPEELPAAMDGYQAPEITSLDLQAEDIHTVIWGIGYNYDSSMFQFPVLNRFGLPDAPNGVSSTYPGLYFIGFPFLPTLKSGFVAGIAKPANYLAERIAGD